MLAYLLACLIACSLACITIAANKLSTYFFSNQNLSTGICFVYREVLAEFGARTWKCFVDAKIESVSARVCW